MSTRVPIQMFAPQQLGTTAGTLHTVGASYKTIVRQLVFVNVSAGAATVTVHLVPSGGTADDTNILVPAKSLAAGEPYAVPEIEGMVLPSGTSIQAYSDTASAITAHGSGVRATD